MRQKAAAAAFTLAMTDSPTFLVSYAADLTDDDRAALDTLRHRLYPPGSKAPDVRFQGPETPAELHARQWTRVQARDGEAAERLVADVLGRKPEGLNAFQVEISNGSAGATARPPRLVAAAARWIGA
jgi:hypothetical protein